MGIAFRVFSDARRKQNRAPAEAGAEAEAPGTAQVDARQAVLRVLKTLPDERRDVFVMHELEGMSAPEISELMAVPVPTTYSRLRQARLDVTAEVRRMQQQEARHG
jgi:RNA polymerase sigma-70 factor (ECF subfamily)